MIFNMLYLSVVSIARLLCTLYPHSVRFGDGFTRCWFCSGKPHDDKKHSAKTLCVLAGRPSTANGFLRKSLQAAFIIP